MELISNFLIQTIAVLGVIILFYVLIYFLRSYFAKKTGYFGYYLQFVTGIIGTPIHELSHALACLIFGHKIDEIKLFTLDDDGCLGYVSHSYNPNNFYHKIGNFFIGVAPIFGGALAIYLIILFGLPNIHSEIIQSYQGIKDLSFSITNPDFYIAILKQCLNVFLILFNPQNALNGWWILWIIIIIFISHHMLLSKADIEGSLTGLLFLLALMLIINLILWPLGYINNLTFILLKGLFYVIPIIFISVLIHIIQALIALIISIFKR